MRTHQMHAENIGIIQNRLDRLYQDLETHHDEDSQVYINSEIARLEYTLEIAESFRKTPVIQRDDEMSGSE